MATDAAAPIDTTNCETEPIRFTGAVQPYGALLVVHRASGLIEAASESCSTYLAAPAQQLLGQPLKAILGESADGVLRADPANEIPPLVRASVAGRTICARSSLNETGQVLVDIEPDELDSGASEAAILQLRQGMERLRKLETESEISEAAARLVRSLTGFEQVMIYRFDHDWNGEVVAESCAPGVESYLGLHYPATDIPRQARELFRLCRVRLISDVGYVPSKLLAKGNGGDIDLGHSSLRSVSPIHIQYLKNMGATSTLVGALVVEGRLWGLISCQQKSGPKHVRPRERDAVAWLCTDLGTRLHAARLLETRRTERTLAARRRALIETIRTHGIEHLMLPEGNADLLGVVDADGFAIVSGSVINSTGQTPDHATIIEICRRKSAGSSGGQVVATHSLTADLGVPAGTHGLAGALFVAVDRHPAMTLVWFRSERSRSIRWAGDPSHPHISDDAGRLAPRNSFAQFLQEIRGQSVPWSEAEIDSAVELKNLIDIEALREREAFSRTVLDSIPEHISVLDAQGFIVNVNDPWKRFAEANGAPELAAGSVGLNYRDICRTAADRPNSEQAEAAWAGIEAVLTKRMTHFTLDYPCDSPDQKRWFRMTVNPLLPPSEGAIVAHQDITQRKQVALALAESERRLHMAAEAGGVGLWELDLATGEAWHTPQHKQIVNLSVGEGAWSLPRLLDQIADEDRSTVERIIREGLTAGHFEWEARVIGSDGAARWIGVKGLVMPGAAGTPPRLAGTATDISARRRIESGLRLQEAILQNMQEGVCLTAVDDGKIVFANPKFESMFGYGLGELAGRHVSVLNAPTDVAPETTANKIISALSSQGVWSGEVHNIRKDGSTFWCQSVVSTLSHEEYGNVWVAVQQDITARKSVEAELARVQQLQVAQLNVDLVRRVQEAEVANHAKTAFLGMMSHELRTPLNAIMGLTGLAQAQEQDAKVSGYLAMAQDAAKHLMGIISDILDITHIESQRVVLAERDFTIQQVFNRVVSIHEKTAIDAKLGFNVEIDPELHARPMKGDPIRFGQVLGNLVGNAIKFTQSGSVTIRARSLKAQTDEEYVRVEIEDTGIGINEDDQKRLFTPFEQLDMSLARPFGGTGLGLGIAARLVELMGGEIGVRSVPGAGSTFWFTVRFRKGVASNLAEHVGAETAGALLRQIHGGARVLLVEDEEINRFFAAEQLREFGLLVDTAELGQKAVELASHYAYAAILMDVKMPTMDGIEATRRIRASAIGASTPILAMTALAFPSDKARCLDAGMNDYLAKPIDREDLAKLLLKWIRPTS